jgi:hypothetical protein
MEVREEVLKELCSEYCISKLREMFHVVSDYIGHVHKLLIQYLQDTLLLLHSNKVEEARKKVSELLELLTT